MILPQHMEGQTIGVFGLARSGRATMRALKAAGATPIGFDDRPELIQDNDTADWRETDFSKLDRLVLSPGVPLSGENAHPVVKRAAAEKVKTCGEFDLFLEARNSLAKHKLVAITGTNGKSTTTALITHMVQENGRDSIAFGNIGTPFLAVKPLAENGVYVAELSSFQLDLSPAPEVNIAILLNITPDHLDRHGTMQAYAGAKAKLFQAKKRKLIPIICVDDPYCRAIAQAAGPYLVPISTQGIVSGGVWVANGMLVDGIGERPAVVGAMADLPNLQGVHNWQNALAAYAAGRRLGFKPVDCFKALASFAGLAHRQETVQMNAPFTVVNDSKATNWESAERALATFSSIRWIAGGRLKGEAPTPSAATLSGVKKAYYYGEAGRDFQHKTPEDFEAVYKSDFKEAVIAALEDAQSGDTVLLSPAATAFDQFPDFEKRGEAFKAIATAYLGAKYKGKAD